MRCGWTWPCACAQGIDVEPFYDNTTAPRQGGARQVKEGGAGVGKARVVALQTLPRVGPTLGTALGPRKGGVGYPQLALRFAADARTAYLFARAQHG